MGFLHKLWDETLAGPTPEAGLGKLRKYDSFSSSSSSHIAPPLPGIRIGRAPPLVVTRSITMARGNRFAYNNSSGVEDSPLASPNTNESPLSSSTPSSPSTPESPGGGGGGRYNHHFHSKRMARRKPSSPSSFFGEPR
ncbi:unnamed protein product [Linum trigynum]|uniref:Dormancy-associated protein homolog 4 n=1 Tax=Linum trigynum TaxID=586398 RepID=A0AAV2DSD1_9ROSI